MRRMGRGRIGGRIGGVSGSLARRISLGGAALLAVLIAGWFSAATDAAPGRQDPDANPTATKPPIRTEITFPTESDILIGRVGVEGTALITDFQQYQLHIAPAGTESWSWLTTEYGKIVRDDFLFVFNSRELADGFYDLRLRSLNMRGNYLEDFVRGVEVRNTNPPTVTPIPVPTDEFGSPLATASLLETPTPTPVPTQVFRQFIPGGQGIYAPNDGEQLGSYARIIGTANGKDIYHKFMRYELYLSPAGRGEWQWVMSSQRQHFNGTLYTLDTTQYPNGLYDLRLRIVYADSNYDEYFVDNLRIHNDSALLENPRPQVEISAPRPGSFVSQRFDVRGTIFDPQLLRWELYWAESTLYSGASSQEWLFLFQGEYQVLDDLIARMDLANVAPGTYDLRLRVIRQDGNYDDFFVRRLHVVLPTPTPRLPVHP